MTARLELVPVAVLGALAAGTVHALFNAIRERLAAAREPRRSPGRLAAAVWYAALLPSLFISGMLIDHLGVEWVLIAGFLSTAVAIGPAGHVDAVPRWW